MSRPKNVFDSALITVLDGLGDLSVASLATRSAMKAANASVQRSIADFDKLMAKANRSGEYFMGATLPVPDYFHSERWLVSHPHRPRKVVRDEIIRLNDEIADRLRSQLVSSGFELLEDFLRETAANCLFQLRNEGRRSRLKLSFHRAAFHSRNPRLKATGAESTLPYFRNYCKFAYRSGLSEFLRELAQNLSLSKEQPEYASILNELVDRYRLIEYCRHVTVHEFGRHETNRLRSLNKWFPLDCISKPSGLTNQPTILISDEIANKFLQIMAGIAYHVYGGVSDAFGMPSEFFSQKKG